MPRNPEFPSFPTFPAGVPARNHAGTTARHICGNVENSVVRSRARPPVGNDGNDGNLAVVTTSGNVVTDLIVTLPDIAGELHVTAQGVDLIGLDAQAPMTAVRALLAAFRRTQPAKGRPPCRPGDVTEAEIRQVIAARRYHGFPVTQLDVAIDLGVSRSTLRRSIADLGLEWRDFLNHPARIVSADFSA